MPRLNAADAGQGFLRLAGDRSEPAACIVRLRELSGQGLSQTLQKNLIIVWSQKDRLPIIAALNNMMEIRWEADPKWTGHDQETS